MAPAHPHATGVAVYPALLMLHSVARYIHSLAPLTLCTGHSVACYVCSLAPLTPFADSINPFTGSLTLFTGSLTRETVEIHVFTVNAFNGKRVFSTESRKADFSKLMPN